MAGVLLEVDVFQVLRTHWYGPIREQSPSRVVDRDWLTESTDPADYPYPTNDFEMPCERLHFAKVVWVEARTKYEPDDRIGTYRDVEVLDGVTRNEEPVLGLVCPVAVLGKDCPIQVLHEGFHGTPVQKVAG